MLYKLVASIQECSKSETLLKNLIITEICGFVWGIMSLIQKMEWWQNPYNKDGRIFLSIVAIIALVLLVFYNYRYFKELALTTKQPLFLYAFWCGVTLILSPVGLVLYVVAWVKFREVAQSSFTHYKDNKAILQSIKIKAYLVTVCHSFFSIILLLSIWVVGLFWLLCHTF